MRVLVTGDRNWTDRNIVWAVLDGLRMGIGDDPDFIVIEGEARGADTEAREWAKAWRLDYEPFPAKWDEHGKSAGPRRNLKMLVEGKPDVVLAFHGDLENSKGTKHMVTIARKAGVPVYHIRSVA